MNLDLDLSAVSRFFRGILTELRQKRLWPVVALLLAAVVAVPFLLSKSTSPAPLPQAQVPTPTPTPAAGSAIPTLNVQTTATRSHLTGPAHNPFATVASTSTVSHGSTPTVVSTATSTAGTGGASSSTATGAGGSSTATSKGSSSGSSPGTLGTTPSSNPPSVTANPKPKAAPSGLKPTQAYDVALAITTAMGGVNTTDPLERLSVIPSDRHPMLVELGVAQDSHRVLFAVQPGTIVSGPGACTPGPIDCEILSLAANQTEKLSTQTGGGGLSEVAQFQVTAIKAKTYRSSAAANRARRAHSSAGRALLTKTSPAALSLFRYEPGLGALVDLRDLKVGR